MRCAKLLYWQNMEQVPANNISGQQSHIDKICILWILSKIQYITSLNLKAKYLHWWKKIWKFWTKIWHKIAVSMNYACELLTNTARKWHYKERRQTKHLQINNWEVWYHLWSSMAKVGRTDAECHDEEHLKKQNQNEVIFFLKIS